jgi:3-hydroxymyristoyl/3-hydroxydecanoyl-(acyl carrier protein) dehydratase
VTPAGDAAAACSWFERIGDGARGRFRFAASLPVFAGHFPGNPLLPGVYQVAAVAELGRRALGDGLSVLAVPRCKWSAMVRPDDDLVVTVQWKPAGPGRWQLDGLVEIAPTASAPEAPGSTTACACRVILG